MNIQMREITVTSRDGRVSQLDQVYIRGSNVRFFIVPDMLKNAPMFKQVGPGALKGRGIGLGRGRATVARAQGKSYKHSICCPFADIFFFFVSSFFLLSPRQKPWWFPWTRSPDPTLRTKPQRIKKKEERERDINKTPQQRTTARFISHTHSHSHTTLTLTHTTTRIRNPGEYAHLRYACKTGKNTMDAILLLTCGWFCICVYLYICFFFLV